MFQGEVVALFIAPQAGAPMVPVESVVALAGRGLQGDRKLQPGSSAAGAAPKPDRELTLIESEAIEAVQREAGLELSPAETRRNVVTRGVPMNHLVGRGFRIGAVTLRGLRLCEPCDHLETLTRPGVRSALVHRGGLRAQILAGGTLNVGDVVKLA